MAKSSGMKQRVMYRGGVYKSRPPIKAAHSYKAAGRCPKTSNAAPPAVTVSGATTNIVSTTVSGTTTNIVSQQRSKYTEGMTVFYQNNSTGGLAKIVKVHLDDVEPYYTISFQGKEKQTLEENLSIERPVRPAAMPPPALAPSNVTDSNALSYSPTTAQHDPLKFELDSMTKFQLSWWNQALDKFHTELRRVLAAGDTGTQFVYDISDEWERVRKKFGLTWDVRYLQWYVEGKYKTIKDAPTHDTEALV